MSNTPDDSDAGNPILRMLGAHHKEVSEMADKHEEVLESAEYRAELLFSRKTIQDLIQSIGACNYVASRWEEFHANYLLPSHVDDIVEAALTAQLAIENGALNPARRELRYMLEVAVNVAYVDEVRAKDSYDERTKYYRGKGVNKSNVDHIHELPLRLLGDHKASFASGVLNAWVKGSNYVHLTKRRIDEKLLLRQQGYTLGFESVEMLRQVVTDVHEACSIVLILVFETIGPQFTADILVDGLDANDDWAFHASGYVAAVDSYFDYKHERQSRLSEIVQRRNHRIRFPITAGA